MSGLRIQIRPDISAVRRSSMTMRAGARRRCDQWPGRRLPFRSNAASGMVSRVIMSLFLDRRVDAPPRRYLENRTQACRPPNSGDTYGTNPPCVSRMSSTRSFKSATCGSRMWSLCQRRTPETSSSGCAPRGSIREGRHQRWQRREQA